MALMACLSSGPTVHVAAIDDTPQASAELRGWVGARLLQECYALVPTAAAAQWSITVERGPDAWSIEVRGETTMRQTIPATDDGVARLELLHRSVEAID
jgi:hypothetical protein